MHNPLFPRVLFKAARAWRTELDKRLKPLGLSQAKWRTLLQLSRAEEPMTQTQLAYRMGIEGPSLVSLLDRLSKDGWVTRREAPGDRRSKIVELTEQAQALIKDIHVVVDQLRGELVALIPAADLEQCISVLGVITEKLEAMSN